jgi:hypothetical protein
LNPGSQAWKACVLNQLDDDRHSDTIDLETLKAIDSTLTMLTNDGLKPNTVRHTKYKLLELAAHVDLFDPEAVKNYVATAISEKTKFRQYPTRASLRCSQTPPKRCCTPLEK